MRSRGRQVREGGIEQMIRLEVDLWIPALTLALSLLGPDIVELSRDWYLSTMAFILYHHALFFSFSVMRRPCQVHIVIIESAGSNKRLKSSFKFEGYHTSSGLSILFSFPCTLHRKWFSAANHWNETS